MTKIRWELFYLPLLILGLAALGRRITLVFRFEDLWNVSRYESLLSLRYLSVLCIVVIGLLWAVKEFKSR